VKLLKHNAFKILLIAAAAAAFTAAGARMARADFEGQYIYGRGAVSASTGGLSIGSRNDTLDYLTNPALINFVGNRRYIFSLGSYRAPEFATGTLSYYIVSYTMPNQSYTLSSGDEQGSSRDMFTYTIGKRTSQYMLGAAISAFRYSTPSYSDMIRTIPSDNGSAFTLDIGAYKEFEKVRASVSIQNLIGNISGTANQFGRKPILPVIYNFGISYPAREWLDVIAGFKIIKYQTLNMETSQSGNMMYLGAEFHTPNQKFSARAGFQSEGVLAGDQKDRAAIVGGGVRTENYDVQLAAYNYLNSYGSPIIATLSYKPDKGAWKEPFIVKEVPAPATSTPQITKPQFETPLPSSNANDSGKKIEPKPKPAPKADVETNEPKPAAPSKSTQIAEFRVDPKIMLIPSLPGASFSDVGSHWAGSYVESLSKEGFYPDVSRQFFQPDAKAPRMEFYRLLFLTQLNRLFSSPINIYFKTPYPVTTEAYVISPKIQQPILLQEGTYEKPGPKRLVINRSMLNDALKDALKDSDTLAGPYKLRLSVSNKDLLPKTLEDYITVVDTSMNFASIESKPPEERKAQIDSLKSNLSPLGINLDYLEGLLVDAGITRIEALHNLFDSASITPPKEFDRKYFFYDVGDLPYDEQSMIFVASRGLRSLEGKPLMGGYPDLTFKPNKEMTNGETAALIDRFRSLSPADFEPPYEPPLSPEITQPKPPSALISKIPSNSQTTSPDGKMIPPPIVQPDISTGRKTGSTSASGKKPTSLSSHIASLPPDIKQSPSYFVISGSFLTKESALGEISRLRTLKYNPFIVAENMDGSVMMLHVAVGAYASLGQAQAAVISVNPENFQPRIIMMPASSAPSGISNAALPSAMKQKQDASQAPKHAEGELMLKGESFIPWNLIQNINEYVPDSADSDRQPE